jgi:hypothetical protein
MIGHPAPLQKEEFELGIMIAHATEEMDGSDRVPHLKLIASELWLDTALLQLERNGALFGVHRFSTLKNGLTPPTLLEMGIFHQWLAISRVPLCEPLPGPREATGRSSNAVAHSPVPVRRSVTV